MFIIGDNEQGFAPDLAGAQTIVHVGNQLLAECDHRRRVLIVFGMAEIGKILGLDEGIGRHLSGLAVGLELPVGLEVAAEQEQLQKRMRLRDVMEIDLPTTNAGFFEAIKDCRYIGKVRRIIVFMAVGGGGMDERLGQVWLGADANQWSQTANCLASADSTGT